MFLILKANRCGGEEETFLHQTIKAFDCKCLCTNGISRYMSNIIVFMLYFSRSPVEAALSIFNVTFFKKIFLTGNYIETK